MMAPQLCCTLSTLAWLIVLVANSCSCSSVRTESLRGATTSSHVFSPRSSHERRQLLTLNYEEYKDLPIKEAHYRFEIVMEEYVEQEHIEAVHMGGAFPEPEEILEVEPKEEDLVCIEKSILKRMAHIADTYLLSEEQESPSNPLLSDSTSQGDVWGTVKKVIYTPNHGRGIGEEEVSVRNADGRTVVYVSPEWKKIHEEPGSPTNPTQEPETHATVDKEGTNEGTGNSHVRHLGSNDSGSSDDSKEEKNDWRKHKNEGDMPSTYKHQVKHEDRKENSGSGKRKDSSSSGSISNKAQEKSGSGKTRDDSTSGDTRDKSKSKGSSDKRDSGGSDSSDESGSGKSSSEGSGDSSDDKTDENQGEVAENGPGGGLTGAPTTKPKVVKKKRKKKTNANKKKARQKKKLALQWVGTFRIRAGCRDCKPDDNAVGRRHSMRGRRTLQRQASELGQPIADATQLQNDGPVDENVVPPHDFEQWMNHYLAESVAVDCSLENTKQTKFWFVKSKPMQQDA